MMGIILNFNQKKLFICINRTNKDLIIGAEENLFACKISGRRIYRRKNEA
jgi:hypothetical protein